ncbi:MAG: mechanosensitive ion channel [Abitibacteriaceae bacterium]|nr:mechanosensitive ion channel [Abditibacteriaceae bacterium]MBV9866389.1 mechanosensitive ion channel [Abditibacteriaceae bacterium]
MNFAWLKIDEGQLLAKTISVLIILIGALVVWLLLGRAARRTRERFERYLDIEPDSWEQRSQLAAAQRRVTALRLVFNTGKYLLCALVIFLILEQVNINLGSLLLPAGFLGAALGLGSQNLVRDMVAGLFIVFEGQFAVGDVVSINGVLGTIEEVGFRVTRLRDDAAQLHFFPNGTITTVARYPYRYVPQVLFVALEDAAQQEKAATVMREAIQRFDAKFSATVGPVEQLTTENSHQVEGAGAGSEELEPSTATDFTAPATWVRFRLYAVPWRLQLLKDKLPASVKAALEKAEVKLEPGTEVEVIPANT